MAVLGGLEPKRVFSYFEEICGIPHGSGNMERISNYLVGFAKSRGLTYYQDALYNVVIIKEASDGYEKEEPIILQGHMDMVAVKKPDAAIDMKKEGLKLEIDGDKISAKDTSLGGDDGIAVAYALALLADDHIKHPRLEVVLTVEEEVGMEGAVAIDLSMLKGHCMINLDSEEEGIFWTSCAGGGQAMVRLPVERTVETGSHYRVKICGLLGGHSGAEIHKGRANSNILMGRVLAQTEQNTMVISAAGGLADNAIPRETEAEFLVKEENENEFCALMAAIEQTFQKEFEGKDDGLRVVMEKLGTGDASVLTDASRRKVTDLLVLQPNGVQTMSAAIDGLVQTSLNLGILNLGEDALECHTSVRSSLQSEKDALVMKLTKLAELFGAEFAVSGEYPAWEYRQDSPLRDRMVAVYRDMYGVEPKIEAIHAGLECGILSAKIPNLDGVSIGPNMENIHTTEETLSISSTVRVWEFLLRVLEQKV